MIDRAFSFDYKCYSFKAMFVCVCIPMVRGQGRLSIGYIGKFCCRNLFVDFALSMVFFNNVKEMTKLFINFCLWKRVKDVCNITINIREVVVVLFY